MYSGPSVQQDGKVGVVCFCSQSLLPGYLGFAHNTWGLYNFCLSGLEGLEFKVQGLCSRFRVYVLQRETLGFRISGFWEERGA